MRKRFTPPGAAALLALSLVLAPAVAAADVDPAGEGQLLFWQARSAGATVYLLGSMHAGTADLYPLDPAIEKAWAESPALVVEVNLDAVDMMALQQKLLSRGMYEQGKDLQGSVSRETWALLGEYLEARGLTTAGFSSMRPWFLSMVLTVTEMSRTGYQEQFGIDRHFLNLAAAKKKPVLELESGEFQLELLSGFDEPMQEMFLVTTLREVADFEDHMGEIVSAWTSGDDGALERLFTESVREDPRLAPVLEKLIYERNEAMALKIAEYLESGRSCFVVVGAAHLVGKRGLVDLLTGMNRATWKVSRVAPQRKAPAPDEEPATARSK